MSNQMQIKIINYLPKELFIIKSERTIQKKQIKEMNFFKKIINYEHNSQSLFTKQKKKQVDNNKVSIIESDALGMTIIDDNLNDENSEQIQPLSPEEWVNVLDRGNLEGYSFSRIYFSFLKGIPTYLRYKIWLFFSTENSLKHFKFSTKMNPQETILEFKMNDKNENGQIYLQNANFTNDLYRKLSQMQPLSEQRIQIDKDVHRTYSAKKQYIYTSDLLRRLLLSLSNSGIQYSQGMNYILLNVIIYNLESIGITNSELFKVVNIQIEKNIFLIMREIVIRMDTVFGNNNIFKVIAQLQQKIAETVPEVLYTIYKLGMDCFSMFSQHYFSLLSYNQSTPELNKLMMDLFFIDGEKAIHAIIVKMLEVSKDKILSSNSPEQLNQFLKKQLFMEYDKVLQKQQQQAKKLTDFGLSFYENRSVRN